VIDYRNWQLSLGRKFRSLKLWFVLRYVRCFLHPSPPSARIPQQSSPCVDGRLMPRILPFAFFVLVSGRAFCRAYGVEGFQAHIRTSVSVGAHLESIVTSTPNFELVTPRALSLLVFRLLPPSPSTTSTTTTTTPIQDAAAATHEANELNRELWSRISARKDFQLTQTLIPGGKKEGGEKIFCIRFALGAPSTRNGHVERAWAVVRELGEELLREKGLI
jgi:aromatic-L-amino-acid decarboxylase